MTLQIDSSILEVFLPEGTFDYFDLVNSEKNGNDIKIVLEERNIPPVREEDKEKKIISKGFYDITITDFPIRGRRALLKFRRRRWQVEGKKELLKRDIKLTAGGTQLEKEFANFLKEDGGRESGLSEFYRRVSADPSQRI